MKILLKRLTISFKQSTEEFEFGEKVTFIHGPIGTGKSTIARLVDYCFGGTIEKTPAMRSEFVAVVLNVQIGDTLVDIERSDSDNSSVRLTWSVGEINHSIIAPFDGKSAPIFNDSLFNFSDMVYHFANSVPILVRKNKRDPDAPLVRLGFRDLLWYCYLDQDHLDSSFYRMEDTFRKPKSVNAMRYFTGLHSGRLNELEKRIATAQDTIRSNNNSADRIREFLLRFELGTETEIELRKTKLEDQLTDALKRRDEIEKDELNRTHAAEPLREALRELSNELNDSEIAFDDLYEREAKNRRVLSELITQKQKASKKLTATQILAGADFDQCPQCGTGIVENNSGESCSLCKSPTATTAIEDAVNLTELLRQDLNTRIDELTDLLKRQEQELSAQESVVEDLKFKKKELDLQLTRELKNYDSAYVSEVRAADRLVAKLQEEERSLDRFAKLPQAIKEMVEETEKLVGTLKNLQQEYQAELRTLKAAQENVDVIKERFEEVIKRISFPGVYPDDRVAINTKNFDVRVFHDDDEEGWGFFQAGSGGKKVLFNVAYALAVHQAAVEKELPVPSFLIVDSPTKNISDDVNPELVAKYFEEIYETAADESSFTQFILIDSDLVEPANKELDFVERQFNYKPPNPPLIPYYEGP